MSSEDLELQLLKLRKLAQLQSKLASKERAIKKRAPIEILNNYLTEKAKEVLRVARSQYPQITRRVIEVLAKSIEEGKIKEQIDGYELYNLFLRLGFPIRMPIKIYYEKKGERKPLSELFKSEND